MNKIIVIDNYDSFTYNLVHLIEEIHQSKIDVYRNDQINLDAVGSYDTIILSPGPGIPEEAGLLKDIIKSYATHKKMLGVCLGHQAIAETFGGTLQNLQDVYHGVKTILHKRASCLLLDGLPDDFEAGRYHSWVIKKETLPECFLITSVDDHDEIMSFRHKSLPLYGVQFHPESVLTPSGKLVIHNFLNIPQSPLSL